jgi:hypothetical protein
MPQPPNIAISQMSHCNVLILPHFAQEEEGSSMNKEEYLVALHSSVAEFNELWEQNTNAGIDISETDL